MSQSSFIRQLREEAGFSQEKLADELGMSRVSYSAVEKGEKDVTLLQAEVLSKMFSVSLDEIREGKRLSISKAVEKEINEMKQENSASTERTVLPRENVKKFKEVLLYILERVGSKPNVGMTVLYKLLYFIDFDYYEKYEEQLIGAKYIKNTFGPTPVSFGKIVESMKAGGEIEEVKSQHFQYDQKKYLPRRSADLTLLSAQEKEMIDTVLARLSDKSATEISNYSHGDMPWLVAKDREVLDYEAVFYRDDAYSVRDDHESL